MRNVLEGANFSSAQGPPCSARVLLGLGGPLRAGNRDDVVVTAQPSEGDLGRRFPSRTADLSEFPDQGGGRPEIRGLEQIVLRADAVLRPLAVMILAGQQAFPDRAPSQDGDALDRKSVV